MLPAVFSPCVLLLSYLVPKIQMAQMIKSLPAIQEAQVQSLGQEDPLEKGMATHSRILAWRIPWMEEPASPKGCKELDTIE